jgi:hypothetical protein
MRVVIVGSRQSLVVEGAKSARDVKAGVEAATGASAAHLRVFDLATGREYGDADALDGDAVGVASTLAGGCPLQCLGCAWYGPCFIRELKDDRGEKTGEKMMGLCTIL